MNCQTQQIKTFSIHDFISIRNYVGKYFKYSFKTFIKRSNILFLKNAFKIFFLQNAVLENIFGDKLYIDSFSSINKKYRK